MLRTFVGLILAATTSLSSASEVGGVYMETRTCAVYTGPCFANAEMGLTGKDAIMAWSIESGAHDGVDVAGLNVVVVVMSPRIMVMHPHLALPWSHGGPPWSQPLVEPNGGLV